MSVAVSSVDNHKTRTKISVSTVQIMMSVRTAADCAACDA